MLLVIDEGTSFAPDAFGEEFAVPSSSEKGRFIRLRVSSYIWIMGLMGFSRT
jgi:hypothetical protein